MRVNQNGHIKRANGHKMHHQPFTYSNLVADGIAYQETEHAGLQAEWLFVENNRYAKATIQLMGSLSKNILA